MPTPRCGGTSVSRGTPSIYAAKASDFVAVTQKVYSTPKMQSRIVLPVVLPGGKAMQ
jgi:hypothetical protein